MIDLLLQRGASTGNLSDPDTAMLRAQVSNLIHRGLVVSVDLGHALATVQVGEVQTAALPWLIARAGGDITWWAPEVGEHVAILCPSGSLSQGIILGSLYSGSNPAPASSADQNITKYSDGTTVTYDRAAHKLTVHAVGDVVVEATGGLTINGDVALNGKITTDLKVAGNVKATGQVVQAVPPSQL
jgi:phage baseplate assembly protein V